MATIIKIKRSSGTTTPNLGQGELGYSWGSSSYLDNQGASVTSYGKLFLGTGTESGGVAANIEVIGGKYFTDMLDHGHGTLTANSAVLVDSASKINVWNVDNLTLDGNTLSSTNTDGDINLDPNGSGEIVIPDDTYLTFGTSKDTKIKYDEATDDRLEVTGADWNFANGVAISISDNTQSTTPSTGALTVTGGVGISGNLNVAGSISAGSLATPANFTVSGDLTVQGGNIVVTEVATSIDIKDNTSAALAVKEGVNEYINITTTNSAELVTIGNNITSVNVVVEDNASNAFLVKEGSNDYLAIDTTDSAEQIILGNDIVAIRAQVEDNSANAFAIRQGSNFYVNIATLDGSELITFSTGNVDIDNDLNIDGGDLTTNQSTFNLLNANATTVNFSGAATTLEIGASTGTTNVNNNLVVDLDLQVKGGDLTTNQATFNLLNTTATTVNAFGAAETVNLGTAVTTVDFGDLKINGSTIYGDTNGQTITLDPYPAGGDAGGDVIVRGNFKVTGTTTTVNSTVMTVNDPIFTLGDAISEKVVKNSASNGATTLTLDNTTGLNSGDIVSGDANIPANTTITVDSATQVTLSAALTGGIAAGTTLTFTQGADDNMDRGIEYRYYNGSLKTGFFGYDESGISEDTTTYYFTYIPDATNTGNVFTGTRGSAYFKTVKLDDGILNGVAFFDQYKRLTRTVAAGTSDVTTSNQILTVNGSGVPVWTTTLDGGTY